MLNRQGRPSSVTPLADDPAVAGAPGSERPPAGGSEVASPAETEHPTFTGNRALLQEEPLIFEFGRLDGTGVDLDEPDAFEPRLGRLERKAPIGLPGLSEP